MVKTKFKVNLSPSKRDRSLRFRSETGTDTSMHDG